MVLAADTCVDWVDLPPQERLCFYFGLAACVQHKCTELHCVERPAVLFVFLSNGMLVAIYSLYIRNLMTGLHKLHLQHLSVNGD